MASNTIHAIKTYSPKALDIFFFDANVWIYIFFPRQNIQRQYQVAYSDFFSKLVSRKLPIYINSLVLSELSNAYMNDAYIVWKSNQSDQSKINKKNDFRPSAEYKKALLEIKTIIETILKIAIRSSDEFNSISMVDVLNEHSSKEFNDSYYVVFAKHKKIKIVTHDSDILNNNNLGIEVISANT